MIIAAVRSVATYLAVSLYVLIVTPPGLLLAVLFGWKKHLYVLGHGGVRLGIFLSGIKVRMSGAACLPRDRAAVFCSNHQSNVDPPILFDVLSPQTHVMYKRELDRIPLLPRGFKAGGFIPVDRRHKEASMRAIDEGAKSIRAGNSFLIFPEGTRSRTDELLPFKKGGFIMAIKAQAPIVPVAVRGGREAMIKGSWIIRPVTFNIRVGEPIETAGYSLDDRDQLIDVVRERIRTLLAELGMTNS